MTGPGRVRSLFWVIAGAFLLSAAIGTLIQVLLVQAVVRPLEAREARARAELAVSSVAVAYGDAPLEPRGAVLDSILRRHRDLAAIRPTVLWVRLQDGTQATAPPEFVHFLPRLLAEDPASRTAPREGDRPPGRNEVIAHHALVRNGREVGVIQAIRRIPRGPASGADSRAPLLYLPIAVVLSGAVALVLVRMLVRRLRAMERLAARVAAGDLSARVADRSGDEIGRVAAQLDLMTERLALARGELELNENQRRQLFADITHELATPLTSIRGAAETLLDPQVPISEEERTRYLRGVLEESRRLDRLIRDLFDLARLEAGAVPFDRERLDWAALCRNTIERVAPRFARAGLRLRWSGTPSEAWVEADGLRLEQVLDNLLVNALRYVPEGGEVSVTLGPAAGQGRFQLEVRDDGPGLPAGEVPHVFERFYRGAAARTGREAREAGGSGLGLAIVREIIERHGGIVSATSNQPQGLRIRVELPTA